MKKFNYSYVTAAVAVLVVSALSSCVNEEYDVKDINTEVTIMQEGLSLPLGSTKQLVLKDLLSGLDEDMLQVLDGGAYAFRINDTLNLGDKLPDLTSVVDIPDVEFENSVLFNLSGIDLESLLIEGQNFDYDFALSEDKLSADILLPVVDVDKSNPTNIWEYGKAAREMEIEVGEIKPLKTKSLFKLPDLNITEKMDIPDLPQASVGKEELKFIVSSESPDGITDISDIMMGASSTLSIKLSVVNSFLASGTVVPDLSLDLGGLIVLDGDKEQIGLGEDFILDQTNSWSASKEYPIKKLNIHAEDWDDEGNLEILNTLVVQGNALLKEISVDPESVAGYDKTKGMDLCIEVGFNDMVIESMMMTLDGIDPIIEKTDIDLSVDDIALPEGVKSIDKVIFTEDSGLELIVRLENLDIRGLQTNLDRLVMTFPEGFKVREAVNGKVELSGDLSKGFEKKVHVEEISFAAPVDGKVGFDGKIGVEAVMTVDGRICSADVPYTEETDGLFILDVESDFDLYDYHVQIEGMTHELDLDPQDFSYVLPEGVSDIGTFSITPEGNPVLLVDFDLPETSLAIQAAEEGVVISFPDFLRFKNVDSSYGYDENANSISLKGKLPDKVRLPIDKVVVSPKLDDETGEYYAGGSINVSGAMEIESGSVMGSDMEAVMSSGISLNAIIPDLKAKEVKFEHFSLGMDESFDFDIFKAGDIPAELKSVSTIELEDVHIVLDVAVSNMPDLGAAPAVSLNITMPEFLVLDDADARVEKNVVSVRTKIEDGHIAIDPIGVKAIDLSSFDLSAEKDLTGDISLSGAISVDDPDIDLKSLSGDIRVDLNASIKDISIEKIIAKVDYKVDGINEKVELTGLPDFVNGDDFVLDLADPHLILKAKTNMGIPVAGELRIIPSFGGVIDKNAAIMADIELPYTETADQMEEVTFWFGGDKSRCPADYTFVEADIAKLVRRIPDELELSLVAGTDADKDCVVEPSADYVLDVEYDFVIPLEFGEDLHIEISDTISGLPAIMGQLLEKNSVQLAGSITSSLPLSLELNIDMLDDDLKAIAMEKPAKLAIAPCASDGSAATSPLDLTLDVKDGVSVKGLSSLKLTFKVTAPNYTGIPIDEADFVQAELKLAVPDGVTLDFAELTE